MNSKIPKEILTDTIMAKSNEDAQAMATANLSGGLMEQMEQPVAPVEAALRQPADRWVFMPRDCRLPHMGCSDLVACLRRRRVTLLGGGNGREYRRALQQAQRDMKKRLKHQGKLQLENVGLEELVAELRAFCEQLIVALLTYTNVALATGRAASARPHLPALRQDRRVVLEAGRRHLPSEVRAGARRRGRGAAERHSVGRPDPRPGVARLGVRRGVGLRARPSGDSHMDRGPAPLRLVVPPLAGRTRA